MTTNNILRLLVTLFVCAGLTAGCTRPSGDKGNAAEREALSADRKKLTQSQAELESLKKDLDSRQAALDASLGDLGKEKSEWEKSRADRELQVMEMTKSLQEKKDELEKLSTQIAELKTKIEAQEAELTAKKAEFEANEKSAQEALDRAQANLKKEEEAKADLSKALQAVADATAELEKARQATKDLLDREAKVVEDRKALEVAQASQAALDQTLKDKETKLAQAIVDARELFSREGRGDVLDKAMSDKPMTFLVSISGRGTAKYIQIVQSEVEKINQGAKGNAFATSTPKDGKGVAVTTPYLVDSQILVSSRLDQIRALRDQMNTMLEDASIKEGAATQFWMIVRPVQKVRVGLKVEVLGSKTLGYKDRKSEKFMELNQVRRTDAQITSIDQVDFSRPGSYVFQNDKDEKKCLTVDSNCIDVLKKNGLLSGQNMLMVKSEDGASTQMSNLDALNEAFKASLLQMSLDHDLYDKRLNIVSLTYSMEEGFSPMIDQDAIKKLKSIYFGYGETRAPIIDQIKLSYRIVMVDEISNRGNHIDTWKFLTSGYLMNTPMFPEGRQRNEIEIQLPIANLKAAEFKFNDLGLADFKDAELPPKEPKELTNAKVAAEFNTKRKAYDKSIRVGKIQEFKKRLRTNMGLHDLYIREIEKN